MNLQWTGVTRGIESITFIPLAHWKPDKHVPSASPGYIWLMHAGKDLTLNFFAGRHNANPGDEDEEESL